MQSRLRQERSESFAVRGRAFGRLSFWRLLGVGVLLFAQEAGAQQSTGLRSVFPPGGQRGATVAVRVSGDEITQAATGLWFSHPGIQAQQTADGTFKVTVRADVPVGLYDVRAVGSKGVTDARTFAVDDLPEVIEQEPNNTPAQATRLPTLPCIVNGCINPAEDIDYFLFHAEAGQRLLIDCVAQRIDATPRQDFIFDGTVQVLSAAGKPIGSAAGSNGSDPFLDITLPQAGDYLLKVSDFTYRGSDQCFYRIHIGVVPHIDYIFPAGGQRGTQVAVTYGGRNLPGGKPSGAAIQGRPLETLAGILAVPKEAALPEGPLPGMQYGRAADAFTERIWVSLPSPQGVSNSRAFLVGDLPEIQEQEPNDTPETATKIPWPCVVNGQAGKPGDMDWYVFTAKKGQPMTFEIFAQRLGSPMDSTLKLYDDKGQPLAENEDMSLGVPEDIFFHPATTDSRLSWTPPADGTYRLLVRDLYSANRGGPEFVYRLEVRAAEPDFRVVVVPDHRQGRVPDRQQVPQGGRTEWMAYAYRRDGFNGEIRVEARGLPPGVTMEPLVFGPGVRAAQAVFTAAPQTPPGTFAPITLVAQATVGTQDRTRQVQYVAVTGSSVNTPTPQRLGRSAVVSVTSPCMVTATAQPAAATAAAGGTLPVKITLQRRADWKQTVEVTPPTFGFPGGLQMANVNIPPDQSEATVQLRIPKNMPPGRYAVTVSVSGQVPRPGGGNQRETYPSSPIVFTVTPAL